MNLKAQLSQKARLALLGGVLLLTAAGVVFTQNALARDNKGAADLKLQVDNQPLKREGDFHTSFAPVVKEVASSVVSVATETKPKRVQGMSPFPPALRQFFGDRFPGGSMMTPRQEGLGSGVIVTEDGYILTNNHVVDDADEITVILNPDGKEYPAKVVGRDSKSDIAVLKIEASGLPAIKIGDSDKVEVGDVVLAIGNPFAVGQTVTMGIVGATGRAVFGRPMGLEYEDFIQTDAAINPGNSGGALIDAQGRLIGLNTAIVSRGGGNNGVGFAVPSNLARNVMENIVEHGRVIRGFLGVNIQDLDPGLASEFGVKSNTEGALVADVTPKSPAAKAGIKVGDVITKFNGHDVTDSRHLKLMVGETAPDKEVTVDLLRDGTPKSVDVVLNELPQDKDLASMRNGGGGQQADVGGLQGVVVGDLTPQLRQQFNLPRTVEGAVVTDLDQDSTAYRSGLREGDVIREINHQPVKDAESAIDAVRDLSKARILLRIWREGGNIFLTVDESKER